MTVTDKSKHHIVNVRGMKVAKVAELTELQDCHGNFDPPKISVLGPKCLKILVRPDQYF